MQGTPATWDTHSQSVSMASTIHDESGDDTTSSLGDSSYDFIDDRSNATTDDEDQDAMTASITSSDGHAFEQVHAQPPANQENDHAAQQGTEQEPISPQHQEGNPDTESTPIKQDPAYAAPDSDPGRDDESIEFEEPSITNLNSSKFIEVSHTLRIIEKHPNIHEYYYNLLDRLQGHLAVTVRQTMTSHSLAPKDGQYKILYVGDQAARESIVQKIGTALAAGMKSSRSSMESPRSSKFNIVPISAFGEESSPEVVLIDSSGLELTVEDCTHASFDRKADGNDSLCLELSGGVGVHSSWNGSCFNVSNDWKLPDLAIFYVSDDNESSLKMTRLFARSFMSRHKVMSIIISQKAPWGKPPTDPIALDYLTPHICLESRKSSFVHAQIIRRYPIDLATFLNLDAGQMNRNLACLASATESSKSRRNRKPLNENINSKSASTAWTVQNIVTSMIADVKKDGLKGLDTYEYLAGFAAVLMCLLGMLVLGLGLSEFLGASRVSTSRVFPTHTSPASIPSISTSTTSSPTIPLSLPSTSGDIVSSSSSSSASIPSTKPLSSNTDLASFLFDAYTLAPNKSEQFKVHVLGDCHIMLRPPHWFTKMKKSPRLHFKVLRGIAEVEHQRTTLFDGVYALQVPREDAYGLINVKVWTELKPIIAEDFEVDFGSSWLKVAGWKKASRAMMGCVREDLSSAQTGLSIVYDHTKTSLSTFVRHQKEKVAAQRSHLITMARTKELIVSQTKDLQRTVSKNIGAAGKAASNEIVQMTEMITKDMILFARNTAFKASSQASSFTRKAREFKVRSMVRGAGDLERRHLREVQKKALKVWWAFSGTPKPKKMKAKVKDREVKEHLV